MSPLALAIHPAALDDLQAIHFLIAIQDGIIRADAAIARIEAMFDPLCYNPRIGRTYNRLEPDRRCISVPKLPRAVIYYRISATRLTIIRVSYLVQQVASAIPEAPAH